MAAQENPTFNTVDYAKVGYVVLPDSWVMRDNGIAPPAGRVAHTATWTGSEMIIWGGIGAGGYLQDGRRYDPAANSWTAMNTSFAPAARYYHTAVWTGTEMIVWGGRGASYFNDGGRYNPAGDTGGYGHQHHQRPATRRALRSHGGVDGQRDDRLGRNQWQWSFERRRPLQSGGQQLDGSDHHRRARRARHSHGGVDGSEMIVWGGFNEQRSFERRRAL